MAASTLLRGGAATLLSTSLARTTTTPLIPRRRLPLFPSRVAAAAAFCSATDSAVVAPVVESEPTTKEAISADAVREAAGLLDIRVGRLMKAWRHPDAETLYVEEVDLGEVEFRVICSGLVNYVTLEELQNKLVVVLANLKPRNMRGVKSFGMLMAASDASHENVELLVPPESSVPGERIWFGLENEQENHPAAATANQIQKKKIWELVQPHLKTDASGTAKLGEHVMRTSGGPVVSKSLKHANIS
ncbi:Aminoacyl tRNA synthase complex-interacting multifunctional protein 1-like protein [Drosera capensis]